MQQRIERLPDLLKIFTAFIKDKNTLSPFAELSVQILFIAGASLP
jgi:hypothetical protein